MDMYILQGTPVVPQRIYIAQKGDTCRDSTDMELIPLTSCPASPASNDIPSSLIHFPYLASLTIPVYKPPEEGIVNNGHNVYVNPLEHVRSESVGTPCSTPPSSSHASNDWTPQPAEELPQQEFRPSQVVQKLSDGLTTTWRRQDSPISVATPSPPTPYTPLNSYPRQTEAEATGTCRLTERLPNSICPAGEEGVSNCRDEDVKDAVGGAGVEMSGQDKAGMAPNRSRRRARLAAGSGRLSSHLRRQFARVCSFDSAVNYQGSWKAGTVAFRRTPFFASRPHASPSTGRKLANYHLIANSRSGGFYPLTLYVQCLHSFSDVSSQTITDSVIHSRQTWDIDQMLI